MTRRTFFSLLFMGLLAAPLLVATPASAEMRLHFTVYQINGGCFVDDQETIFQGDPERYFRIGVFDSGQSSVINDCLAGCVDDGVSSTVDAITRDFCSWNTGCGTWDFPDQTIVKYTPDRDFVSIAFNLFDEDNDEDDSLGRYWVTLEGPSSGTFYNNNAGSYGSLTSVCGRAVEGGGVADNFTVTFDAYYVDTTPPCPGNPSLHEDGQVNPLWDNDTRWDLTWDSAYDWNSGLQRYVIRLLNVTDGYWHYYDHTIPYGHDLSICPSGCGLTFTPTHGVWYNLYIGAENGSLPEISNPQITYSSAIGFGTDLVYPETVITNSSGWYGPNQAVLFSDTDSGSGIDPDTCTWRIQSSGVETLPWTSRPCNTSVVATVAPDGHCREEGVGTCTVSAYSSDLSRQQSEGMSRVFGIDWTPDAVADIDVFETPGDIPVGPGSPWFGDNTPAVQLVSVPTLAPIAGHSWSLGPDPDCVIDTPPGESIYFQLPQLPDGQELFKVRAIDEAGNCGVWSSILMSIDGSADHIHNLHALDPVGDPIYDGVWTDVTNPTMLWQAVNTNSPPSYSYDLGATADCVVDTSDTWVDLGELPDGITPFSVRVIDEVGNCGGLVSFDLAVDTTPDTVGGLQVWTEFGGDPIQPMVWQTDNDPFVTWSLPVSDSPIVGYSLDVDTDPECVATLNNSEYLFFSDALSDGVHEIRVRSIDEASNCGPVSTFEIWVNSNAGVSPGDILGGLRIGKNVVDPNDLDLEWTPSCSDVAIDFAVHEGTLGLWYSHGAVTCTTSNELTMTIAPDALDSYYLVVPVSWSEEGTYGSSTLTGERPVGSPACMAVQAPAPHCP